MMMNKPRIVVLSGTGISIWYAQDERIKQVMSKYGAL